METLKLDLGSSFAKPLTILKSEMVKWKKPLPNEKLGAALSGPRTKGVKNPQYQLCGFFMQSAGGWVCAPQQCNKTRAACAASYKSNDAIL